MFPKKIDLFYLFLNYNMVNFKVHPLCLHTTFPAMLPLFVALLERSLWNVFVPYSKYLFILVTGTIL